MAVDSRVIRRRAEKIERDEYQKKIRAFYEPLLAAHGDKTAAVGYPKAAEQRGRYVMLCEVGDLTTA